MPSHRSAPSATDAGTPSPTLLTFTPANWTAPQTVTVTGGDDLSIDGDQPYSIVLGAATSGDLAYNGFTPVDVGVTNDDNDSGVDIVDDTFVTFAIDASDLSAVRFLVNGTQVMTLDMDQVAANTLVQPIVAIQRDAGTEAEVLTIDYIHCTWERT
jgi:hypothetical protein